MAVETNGTQPAPEGIDWICVSPKSNAPVVLTRGNELKLVFPQEDAMPDRFESRTPPWRRGLRVLVASAVGLTIFGLALLTGDVSPETPASDAMLEESLPEGDGRNVVKPPAGIFPAFRVR